MKKVLMILLPILLILGILFLAYILVISDMVDPPPDKVVTEALVAAQVYLASQIESNEERFIGQFTERTQVGMRREWRAVGLDASPRGSWYALARGMLNSDGTLPEILGVDMEEDEEGETSSAVVRVRINRAERQIPMERERGAWKIHLPRHPASWVSTRR